jgi:hypothetical protein
VDALRRVAAGGTAPDPEVVAQLVGDVGHRRVLAVLRYLGVNPLQ